MIRFFSINDPYRLLPLCAMMLLFGGVIHFMLPDIALTEINGIIVGEMMNDGKQLYAEIWTSISPISAFAEWILIKAGGRSIGLRHTLAVLLLCGQMGLFAILLNRNQAFDQQGYLPALFFACIVFISLDSIFMSREILASGFLLLTLDRLFRQLQFRNQKDSILHLVGFYLGLASLCSFTYIIFFPAVFLILAIGSILTFRMMLLLIIGFLFPHCLVNIIWFSFGEWTALWNNYYLTSLGLQTISFISIKSLLYLYAVPLTYFSLLLIFISRHIRLTRYQSQIFLIMLVWLGFGIVEVILTSQRTAQSLIVCAPPTAFLITHFILRIRKRWIAEIAVLVFFAGTLSVCILSLQKRIPEISFEQYFTGKNRVSFKNKRILSLTDDLSVFKNNQVATYFPEWKISAPLFRDPGFYENVIVLNNAFRRDPPDIIIDPENLMPGVFRYLPELSFRYRKSGSNYIRNN